MDMLANRVPYAPIFSNIIWFTFRAGGIAFQAVELGVKKMDSDVSNDFPHLRESSCRISMLLPPALHSLPELA